MDSTQDCLLASVVPASRSCVGLSPIDRAWAGEKTLLGVTFLPCWPDQFHSNVYVPCCPVIQKRWSYPPQELNLGLSGFQFSCQLDMSSNFNQWNVKVSLLQGVQTPRHSSNFRWTKQEKISPKYPLYQTELSSLMCFISNLHSVCVCLCVYVMY